jgi:hypothetical protein
VAAVPIASQTKKLKIENKKTMLICKCDGAKKTHTAILNL